MNKISYDILKVINNSDNITQREISERLGVSLGKVNNSYKELVEHELVKNDSLTDKGEKLFQERKPKNAVILAAGFGMRMVPINTVVPKGLLEIEGETLIERNIKFLHETGIKDITVVVGFMKEAYEYLIDKYDVHLVYNDEYQEKNNLYSLYKVKDKIQNTYIIPCDVWCKRNPFNTNELYSWYMMSNQAADHQDGVRVNKQSVITKSKTDNQKMIGIAYITDDVQDDLKETMEMLIQGNKSFKMFWEKALFDDGRKVFANLWDEKDVREINTYEELRDLDQHSDQLNNEAISTIVYELDVKPSDIVNIKVLKKGMTNRSFFFECLGKKYIMRIPGEGTDELINREDEAEVYDVISGKGLCDDNIYLNPKNGYKITKYIDNVKNADPFDRSNVEKCMKKLKYFHDLKLTVDHTFDLYERIDFYESLWDGNPSIYRDYETTKKHIFEMKSYIDQHALPYQLTHIDAVCDNFLFSKNEDGSEKLDLTDWEYASMQDPHVDIAMFAIYAMYDRKQIDELIDIYFDNNCPIETRLKIYCYVATCGLVWSNWCEFKRNKGVEFGEYSLAQYRYAKDYYRIFNDERRKYGI